MTRACARVFRVARVPWGLVLVRAGRIRGRSRGPSAGGYFLETIGVFGDGPNGPGGLLRRRPHFVAHVERGFVVGVAEQLNSGRHLLDVGPVAIAARHAVGDHVDPIRRDFRSVDHAGAPLHRPLRRLAPEMLVAGLVGHLHTEEIVRASSRKFFESRDLRGAAPGHDAEVGGGGLELRYRNLHADTRFRPGRGIEQAACATGFRLLGPVFTGGAVVLLEREVQGVGR
jgi:hypothetical protein